MPGLFASLKRLLKTIAAIAENRLELFLVEWQEERLRSFEVLLLAGLVLILSAMVIIAGWVWDRRHPAP